MGWVYQGGTVTMPLADLEMILRDRAEWVASAQAREAE